MTDGFVTLADIDKARHALAGKVVRTPTVQSASLSKTIGTPVHLKLEHRQITGSFKLRGATNALSNLTGPEKQQGVVAASTGNHGRALAFAAHLEGVRAVICMSSLVPQNKVDEIRRLGADIRIIGKSQDDAQEEVARLVREDGFTMVPPFDNANVIAGQGTLGLEIVEDVPEVETVVVPVSGGGLASGVAAAIRAVRPSARIIGVSMDRGAAMRASLDAGKPVLVEEYESLADSLGGGIGLDNRLTFAMIRDLLDDVILLTEEEIAAGMAHAYAQEREIIEGAAAVGIGALLAGKASARGPIVAILSGRNVDMNQHRRIVCADATGERAIPCPA
ncbi:hydroxyectoine utilization dehydratase EutB [Phyllobacterium brassicacearum]|uniref:Hydroxyectoine utilization dehydratase EutB n=1 Tax=Phyllobacterium brassicacearum TaxID=314235 RepID=A0A2P7BV29_9HYPH|nr:hydroxyectoine utilization dehydratase EutB [Phyllobacterium brassicacearum]PSH70327.1 hydroxyectoine utilization dehydratase EutB [Phyllobacterium brassicacearum]TDQ28092.1 threonine dehydratase [Phyllobacterium brassicacearum]